MPALDQDDVIRASFPDWLEGFGAISGDKPGQVIRHPELRMNDLQERVSDAIEWCEINGEPCRLLILKPRKEGATTILVGKSYHLLRSSGARLVQIGDDSSTTQLMIDMLHTYQHQDEFGEWGNKVGRWSGTAKSGFSAEWSHGARATGETAGDNRAGQGKTPTIIHAEEVAHWGKDGAAANASDTMLALLNSIRDVPGTYVFVSSTANGVGNWYHRTHDGAVSLDERKRGIKGNGWIKVFQPWHASDWCRKPVTDDEIAEMERSLTPDEAHGCETWGWTWEQVAWRRHTIANKCDGDSAKFGQEYPSDEETCFLTSGRPVFSKDGLDRLAKLVALAKPQHGILDQQAAIGTVFRPDDKGGWLTVWEQPTVGLSYVASLDTMRGEQSEGSKDPDCHSFWVLRQAYIDSFGVHHNARAVARMRYPCRWDATPLAEKVYATCKWYGDCMIVPEINKGLDVLNMLKHLGANIYRRQRFDRINPGKTIMTIGWETTVQTRPMLVSAVVRALREQDVDIECPNALKEMRTFVYDSRGKATGSSGMHDDDVIAIGIGLECLPFAQRMRAPALDIPHYWDHTGDQQGASALGGACD